MTYQINIEVGINVNSRSEVNVGVGVEAKSDRIKMEVRWDQRWSRQSKCQVVKEGRGVKLDVRLDIKLNSKLDGELDGELDIWTEEYNLNY